MRIVETPATDTNPDPLLVNEARAALREWIHPLVDQIDDLDQLIHLGLALQAAKLPKQLHQQPQHKASCQIKVS